MAADRVDLVHEDDARRSLLGLLEEVADAAGAHAHEHLDEVRARDREERHTGLAGDRAGEQRLTGARRPVEQHALGNARAEGLELLGFSRNSLISCSSSTASSTPATSLKPIFERRASSAWRGSCRSITFEPPPCIWFIRKIQKPIRSKNGRNEISSEAGEAPLPFESVDALLLQQALEGQLRLVAGVVRLDGRRAPSRPP